MPSQLACPDYNISRSVFPICFILSGFACHDLIHITTQNPIQQYTSGSLSKSFGTKGDSITLDFGYIYRLFSYLALPPRYSRITSSWLPARIICRGNTGLSGMFRKTWSYRPIRGKIIVLSCPGPVRFSACAFTLRIPAGFFHDAKGYIGHRCVENFLGPDIGDIPRYKLSVQVLGASILLLRHKIAGIETAVSPFCPASVQCLVQSFCPARQRPVVIFLSACPVRPVGDFCIDNSPSFRAKFNNGFLF